MSPDAIALAAARGDAVASDCLEIYQDRLARGLASVINVLDPDTIVLYEQYADAEALEAHRASAHFEQWATNGLYRKMRERLMETLVEIETVAYLGKA